MDVDERVALAEEIDGQDLADSVQQWAEETPANQLRWHEIVADALTPHAEVTVLRAQAITVDDVSPLDPAADDPAVYRATATVDAGIERHAADEEPVTEQFEGASVVVDITATLGRDDSGGATMLVHDLAAADEEP
jgi:hypothetical protein